MSEEKIQNVVWLRIACWIGIVTDAVLAIQMLFPRLLLATFGLDLEMTAEFVFAMRFGVPLMVGWTVLLFWADRSPVERCGVLLITAFPVVVGFVAVVIYAAAAGFATYGQIVPALAIQAVLLVLLSVGYFKGRQLNRGTRGDEAKREVLAADVRRRGMRPETREKRLQETARLAQEKIRANQWQKR